MDLCQFALAWTVDEGFFEDVDLTGRQAVMVGFWDAGDSGRPWTVGVFVDADASSRQRGALGGILTGRHGGTPGLQYAGEITEVLFIEPAEISIDHTPKRQSIKVQGYVSASALDRYPTDSRVSCGIPGHDREGYEVVMQGLEVATPGIAFAYAGNCGFVASYDYRSDQPSPRR